MQDFNNINLGANLRHRTGTALCGRRGAHREYRRAVRLETAARLSLEDLQRSLDERLKLAIGSRGFDEDDLDPGVEPITFNRDAGDDGGFFDARCCP